MKEGIYNMNELKRITIIQSVLDKKRTQKEKDDRPWIGTIVFF